MKLFLKPVVFILLGLALLACAALMALVRPLLSSRAYVVTARVDGEVVEAKLLRPAFSSGLYYLDLKMEPPSRYGSFLIHEQGGMVAAAAGPRGTFLGVPYVHADAMGGIALTRAKIDDTWSVSVTPDEVNFSNATISVQMKKQP